VSARHSGNALDSINIVTLRQAWLVPGWVTVFGWTDKVPRHRTRHPVLAKYLGTEPGTQYWPSTSAQNQAPSTGQVPLRSSELIYSQMKRIYLKVRLLQWSEAGAVSCWRVLSGRQEHSDWLHTSYTRVQHSHWKNETRLCNRHLQNIFTKYYRYCLVCFTRLCVH